MSERIRHRHESGHEHVSESFDQEHRRLEEAHERASHEASKQEVGSIEKILDTIEREATSTKEFKAIEHDSEHKENHAPMHVGHTMRHHGYQQTIKKVQRQLPASQRKFSKVIHNPAVEQVSNVAGETVARPSGLLWGGVFSLIANLVVIIVCRYYGYEYNYLVGIVSFIGGFGFGLLVEAVTRSFSKKNTH
jgi:tetrahydromethanopterin S-methyltransferase subunit G